MIAPLMEILDNLKSQNIEMERAKKRLDIGLAIIAVIGFLCVLMMIRIHMSIQLFEATEVQMKQLSKKLEENIVLSRSTSQVVQSTQAKVDEVKKDSEEKSSIALVPDEKKPSGMKVILIPPKTPQPVPTGSSTSKPTAGVELPVQVPGNVSLQK